MRSRTRSRWLIITLVFACIVTGVWMNRIQTITRATGKSLQRLTIETQQRARDIDTLRKTLANSSAQSSSTPLSPEEQIQHDRRTLIAQLKQARLTAPPAPSSPRPPRDPSGPSGDQFPELMSDPEYAHLAARMQRHETRTRWLHAFRYANIPPEKQDQLRALLHEFGTSGDDATLTAQRAGASKAQSWIARRQAAQEVSAEITALIGPEASAKLQLTELAEGAEELVERLEKRLSYSATPLTSSQATQLFELSVDQNLDRIVTDSTTFPELIEKARPFLSQAQLHALRAISSEFNGSKSRTIVPSPAL